jgi:probable rRNA maturation factor
VSVEGIDGDPSGESIRAVSAAEHSTIFASVLQELYPSLKSFESVDLSVAFVSSEYMKNLNLQYRELDEPTDVLSFPLWEVDGAFRPTWSGPDLPLGDVVICEDIVRESAEEQGILFFDAMCLILSHGVLHLIGFDHYSEEDRVRMFELQETMRDGLVSFSRNNSGHVS